MNLLMDAISAEDIVCLIIILFLSFIGSLSKDYVTMFNGKYRINIKRIIFSTFTASILTFVFSPLILDSFGFRGIIATAYIAGLVGFELLQRLSTMDGFLDLLEKASMLFNLFKFSIIFLRSERTKKNSKELDSEETRSQEVENKIMENAIKADEADKFEQFIHEENEKNRIKKEQTKNKIDKFSKK